MLRFDDFICDKCNHIFEAGYDKPYGSDDYTPEPITKPCPNCNEINCITRKIAASNLNHGVGVGKGGLASKLDNNFKAKIEQIKKSHYKSTIQPKW